MRQTENIMRKYFSIAALTCLLLAPLAVPAHLRSGPEPGSYILQARGEIGRALRRAIEAAGGALA